MKFLICPASRDMIDATEQGDLFEDNKGKEYMYSLDFDGEMVTITDTVGRYVPIDVDDIDSFIFILSKINSYVKNTRSVSDFLYEKLIQGAST